MNTFLNIAAGYKFHPYHLTIAVFILVDILSLSAGLDMTAQFITQTSWVMAVLLLEIVKSAVTL